MTTKHQKARRASSEPKTAKRGKVAAKPRTPARSKPQTSDARRAGSESKTSKRRKPIAKPRKPARSKSQANDARRAANESKTAKRGKAATKPRKPASLKPQSIEARRARSEPKTAKTVKVAAEPRKSARSKPQTSDERRAGSESKISKRGKSAKPRSSAEPQLPAIDARRASNEPKTAKRGEQVTTPRRPAGPSSQTHHASPLRAWSVGAALLLLAAIVGHHLAQTHQLLKPVQAELNMLREDSIQAKMRAAKLEEATVALQAELGRTNAERTELQSAFGRAASQIGQLYNNTDAVKSLLERQLTELEALPRKVEETERTAEQAEARAAESKSMIDALRHRQKAIQAELKAHQQAILQATSEAEGYKRQTGILKSQIERGQQARASLERELDQAKSQITQLKEASLKAAESLPKLAYATIAYPPHGAKTRDYLIRTVAFEAGGESELGKAAVAHVVLNRVRSGKWGDSVEDVVKAPWQFEPWTTRRKELEKLHPFDPRFQKAARVTDAVLAGEMPDPTAGATHFLNPVVVRKRRGGTLPLWARRKGQPIGRHVFYAPKDHDAEPESDDASRVSAAHPARASSPAGPG